MANRGSLSSCASRVITDHTLLVQHAPDLLGGAARALAAKSTAQHAKTTGKRVAMGQQPPNVLGFHQTPPGIDWRANSMPKKKSKISETEAIVPVPDEPVVEAVLKPVVVARSPPVQAHRCRFVDFTPVAITSIAFNSASTALVLGRADASLEFWTPLTASASETLEQAWAVTAVRHCASSFLRPAFARPRYAVRCFLAFLIVFMRCFTALSRPCGHDGAVHCLDEDGCAPRASAVHSWPSWQNNRVWLPCF